MLNILYVFLISNKTKNLKLVNFINLIDLVLNASVNYI